MLVVFICGYGYGHVESKRSMLRPDTLCNYSITMLQIHIDMLAAPAMSQPLAAGGTTAAACLVICYQRIPPTSLHMAQLATKVTNKWRSLRTTFWAASRQP
mmetsp:Transcript_12179/g.20554  ORF Transcript_12179/g.20554 Transcript_12179/m.20554 type:complete len:101 (-) Transcript_12179:1542-1844(-)